MHKREREKKKKTKTNLLALLGSMFNFLWDWLVGKMVFKTKSWAHTMWEGALQGVYEITAQRIKEKNRL